MKRLGSVFNLAALALTLMLGACANYDTRLTSQTSYLGNGGPVIDPTTKENLALKKSYWDGDGLTGAPSIVINLSKQTATFYKGGQMAGVSAISSGREGHDTPPGSYKIIKKEIDHRSNLYGDFVDASGTVVVKNVSAIDDKAKCPAGAKFQGASMPYFMRLTNAGVGMHQGYLPGVADSHGCIRMPEKMVKIYWNEAPVGTPVTIVN